MTDYIFLKISELALRAIKAPRKQWRVVLTYVAIDGEYAQQYFSNLPIRVTQGYQGLTRYRFPRDTIMKMDRYIVEYCFAGDAHHIEYL